MSLDFFPIADAPTASLAIGWIALAVAVIAGLAIGFDDVRRFKLRRIWALSGVCFTESMRRRVWLVTPLAILGVIVVSQLQRAADHQDAVRQTAKFCVFASGLVVVSTALILACTNLPREIESRVIFTIVTKPTTRLEIVIGKVLGFARVTAAVLLIMGIFSFIYLEVRNHARMQMVREQLVDLAPDAAGRTTLAHYADHGFLQTRSFNYPSDLNIYSRLPSDNMKWMRGGTSQFFISHFAPTEAERGVLEAAAQQNAEVDILTTLRVNWLPVTPEEQTQAVRLGIPPLHPQPVVPFGPSRGSQTAPVFATEFKALLQFRLVNEVGGNVVKPEDIGANSDRALIENPSNGTPGCIQPLAAKAVRQLSETPEFWVDVSGGTPGTEFGAGPAPVVLYIPAANNGAGMVIRPPAMAGQLEAPKFLSRSAKYGMLVIGAAREGRSVAEFSFRGASSPAGAGDKVAFQLDAQLERTGDYNDVPTGDSICQVNVVNARTGRSSGPIRVTPELGHLTFFDVPAEDVAGGDFDVQVRGLMEGQWIEVRPASVALITAEQSFAVNLFKSFLLLWMLSILVIAISVFCSTFLSWPIAVVVTLILLLGRWGVIQMGDTLNPGVGRNVATDFFPAKDAAETKAVSSAVEALSKGLRTIAVVLPDVSEFPASEDLERGISIPLSVLGEAAESLLIYGVIVIVGGYIILRFTEVAP